MKQKLKRPVENDIDAPQQNKLARHDWSQNALPFPSADVDSCQALDLTLPSKKAQNEEKMKKKNSICCKSEKVKVKVFSDTFSRKNSQSETESRYLPMPHSRQNSLHFKQDPSTTKLGQGTLLIFVFYVLLLLVVFKIFKGLFTENLFLIEILPRANHFPSRFNCSPVFNHSTLNPSSSGLLELPILSSPSPNFQRRSPLHQNQTLSFGKPKANFQLKKFF